MLGHNDSRRLDEGVRSIGVVDALPALTGVIERCLPS
jgi:hypothetical protein